jgi:proteasome lid subunit RPN8/RPN11
MIQQYQKTYHNRLSNLTTVFSIISLFYQYYFIINKIYMPSSGYKRMSVEKYIKNALSKTFERLFDLDKQRFESITIEQDVVENIVILAKENSPKEFLAFLDGTIKNKKLVITSLLYQEYDASNSSAAPIFRFPNNTFYGSVHSHPGFSNKPSTADKQFFRKIGIINIIICKPYDINSIKFYNHEGEEIQVKIE